MHETSATMLLVHYLQFLSNKELFEKLKTTLCTKIENDYYWFACLTLEKHSWDFV